MMTAMLHDQLGTALAVQRANLPEVGTKLDCAGLIVLVELQLAEFQFPNTNQHSSTGLSHNIAQQRSPHSPGIRPDTGSGRPSS